MKRTFTQIIFVLMPFGLMAQEKLTLKDAIRIGMEKNFDIRIQTYDVQTAKNNNNWGEAGRYPNVSFSIGQNNNNSTSLPASPFPVLTTSNSLVTQPNLSVQWTLFNGQKVVLSKKRLEKLQEQSETDVRIIIEKAIQSIVQNYYQLVLEKQKLNVRRQVLELSKDKYEYARLQKELGTGGSFELLQQESNYLADSISLINQLLALNNANRVLNQVIGEKAVNKTYNLYETLHITSPKPYDLEELFEKTKSSNYTLKKEHIALQLSSYDLRISKTDLLPKIDLNAGYRADITNNIGDYIGPDPEDTTGGFALLNGHQGGYNYGPYLNLTASIMLFSGGKLRRAVENAKLKEIQSRVRIEKIEQDLYKQLSDALDLYNTRRQLFNLNSRNKEVAKTNLELSEQRLKTGTINSFDYRQIQTTYLNAALSELESVFNLITAETDLFRLSGGLLGNYE